jgi:gas vesicle protein
MKKSARRIFAFTTCAAVMLTLGCAQPEPPGVKKSRLIASENMQLKKELQQRGREIEKLREQYSKEINKQQKLLAGCLEEKETWKQKARRNVRNQVKDVFDTVMEQNKKLREENEKLESQIEQLKAKIRQLENRLQ